MRPRHGVSKTIVAIALAAIALMVGSSLYLLPSPGNRISSSSTDGAATLTASWSPTASTTSTTSTSTFTALLPMSFTPEPPMISPYLTLNYTLYFVAIGPVASPLTITLTPSVPISMSFTPRTIVVPGPTPTTNVTVTMHPSQSVAPGIYPVTVLASGQGQNYTENLTVQVVKYLIVSSCSSMTPTAYTIPVNSSVTWLRLNAGERIGCILGVDLGLIDVVIPSLNVTSVTLLQYQSFTYTFTKPGAYAFHCAFHPNLMYGVITVTD